MKMYTLREWLAEGEKLFGTKDFLKWEFVCVNCETIQTGQDLIDAGVCKKEVEHYLGFSCIGRFNKDKGCDWTLDGLFQIHKAKVILPDSYSRPVFEFAKKDK